jgi:hypothetical protein
MKANGCLTVCPGLQRHEHLFLQSSTRVGRSHCTICAPNIQLQRVEKPPNFGVERRSQWRHLRPTETAVVLGALNSIIRHPISAPVNRERRVPGATCNAELIPRCFGCGSVDKSRTSEQDASGGYLSCARSDTAPGPV